MGDTESKARKQIPSLEGWFAMPPAEPRLIGNRCPTCGRVFFPRSATCQNPYCKKTDALEEVRFGQRGKLYTFTTNYFKPPPPYHSPDPFVPYSSGWIQFPEVGLMVQSMLMPGYTEKELKIGMDMELVIAHLYDDNVGNEVLSWKYRPVGGK